MKTTERATERQCEDTIIAAAKMLGWREPFPERIASRVQVTETCWLWIGELDRRGGYGAMALRDERGWHRRKAHRLIYELLVGPISDGLVLDHLCRTPRCVNPEHLDPVTQAENIRRGRWRWRWRTNAARALRVT